MLPPLLASFIGKFPQVSLSLLNGNSREIEAALQEHRIDLGFVEGVFRLPNIRYTTFLEDELVAVVRTGSKLAVGEEITPDELFHLPLVLRERGSGTLDVFERALQQHNIKLSSSGFDVSGKHGKYQIVFGTYRLSGHCFCSFHYARIVFWTVACR